MEEARQACFGAERRLLKGLSPYIGRVTVLYTDETEKVQRLRGLNGKYVDAAKHFHKAVGTFLAFVHERPATP
ncbi:MAG: hypothetical protein V3S20_07790 [Dehalococcoidia bacterium]